MMYGRALSARTSTDEPKNTGSDVFMPRSSVRTWRITLRPTFVPAAARMASL